MTTDNDNSAADGDEGAMPDTGGMDTVMAAGTPSGAAGVANADLGTGGPPAEAILTPEELAETEVVGGAGLKQDEIRPERLEQYFGESEEITG